MHPVEILTVVIQLCNAKIRRRRKIEKTVNTKTTLRLRSGLLSKEIVVIRRLKINYIIKNHLKAKC